MYPLLRLSRAYFLIPGLALYVFGTLFALGLGSEMNWGRFALGYAIFGPLHLSVHFSNDYFDRYGDSSDNRTLLSGGSGVLVDRPDLAGVALGIAVGLIAVSVSMTFLFIWLYPHGWPFLLFVLLGVLLAWFYSAPPVRFSARGLSEVTTALGGGLLMPGMGYYVTSGGIDHLFILISLPLICYGVFFILTVELPDVEVDASSDKTNLLVRNGRDLGWNLALVFTILGTVLLLTIALWDPYDGAIDLWYLTLLSLIPLASAVVPFVRYPTGRPRLERQVMANMTSIVLFLFLADIVMWL